MCEHLLKGAEGGAELRASGRGEHRNISLFHLYASERAGRYRPWTVLENLLRAEGDDVRRVTITPNNFVHRRVISPWMREENSAKVIRLGAIVVGEFVIEQFSFRAVNALLGN